MRLQKFLARAGVASRRASEDLIAAGRVRVDGEVVQQPGVTVDPRTSVVEVDGRRLRLPPARWVILHKPPGTLCSRSDPSGRPTIYDLLPTELQRLFHVGRLDYMSEGLLLMTNDGDAANRLLHPSAQTPRRYEVALRAPAPEGLMSRLLAGVELEDGPAGVVEAALVPTNKGGETILTLTLREGRNREIRRLMDAVGATILSLKRVELGPIRLGDLPRGQWRELTREERESIGGEDVAEPDSRHHPVQ